MILTENNNTPPEFIRLSQLLFEKRYLENSVKDKLPLNQFKYNVQQRAYYPVNLPDGDIKITLNDYIELVKKGYTEAIDENN